MKFEWDEQKRETNLEKHGVDFEDAKLIFSGQTVEIPDNRHNYGEHRIGAFGEVKNNVFFVVYTQRGEKRRIISARKAGTNERELYYSHIARERTNEQQN